MASIGSYIKKANFSTSWTQSLAVSPHSNSGQNRYIFICAPVWYLNCWCNWYAFGGSGQVHIYASYWNGSSWSSESHWFVDASGVSWGGSATNLIGHNRSSGMTYTIHNDYPLWRIRYYPARSNSRWTLTAYAGGWGMCDVTGYYEHSIGHKIYSRGRSGKDGLIYNSGTTDSSTSVVNSVFNPTTRRGAKIMASDDSELVYYPYKQ